MTERQKKTLDTKKVYNKKIFFAVPSAEDEIDAPNTYIIADLDSVMEENDIDNPDDLDQDSAIPDYTPDWLYEIVNLWGLDEYMESYFTFDSPEDVEEFKEICDIIQER